MKRISIIGLEDRIGGIVFRILFLFSFAIGLLFTGNHSGKFFSGTTGYFLEETNITSPHSGTTENKELKQTSVGSEEKEEKETEPEKLGADSTLGLSSSVFGAFLLGNSRTSVSNQFEPYPKRKLYILFHCLKSDLA